MDAEFKQAILHLSERIKEATAHSKIIELDLFRYKEAMKLKLEDFALKTTLDETNKMFEQYASKSENANFERRMKPLLESCEQMLLKCSKDNQNMREAIIEFDIVNASKATKWDLEELRVWIQDDFVSIKETHKNSFGTLKNEIKK